MNMEEWAGGYLKGIIKALGEVQAKKVAGAVELVRKAGLEGAQVFACGNGGSSPTCSHFVTDLGKGASDASGKRFKCMSLTDAVGWMTAIANDYSYEEIFVRQLENFAAAGDVLLCVSVSGTSPSVVRAAEWASEHGLRIIALLGNRPCRLADMADVSISVDSPHYGVVEDAHLVICHMICYAFMDNPEYLLEGRMQ